MPELRAVSRTYCLPCLFPAVQWQIKKTSEEEETEGFGAGVLSSYLPGGEGWGSLVEVSLWHRAEHNFWAPVTKCTLLSCMERFDAAHLYVNSLEITGSDYRQFGFSGRLQTYRETLTGFGPDPTC